MNSIAFGVLAAVIVGIGASAIITWASGLRPVVSVLLAIGIVMLLALIAVGILSISFQKLT